MISIVLPVSNQADFIGRLLTAYMATLEESPAPFELIVVVNASTDDSLARCRQVADEDARVRVLHTELAGWGRAVRLGLAAARGEVLSYTNSARTQPGDLAALLRAHGEQPHSVVKAKRLVRDSGLRRFGSQLYNAECRLLFGLEVGDINGTPKVFARGVLEPSLLQDNGDLLDLEVVLKCKRLGVPVREVVVTSARRHGGVSTTRLKTAYGLFSGALRWWLEDIRSHA